MILQLQRIQFCRSAVQNFCRTSLLFGFLSLPFFVFESLLKKSDVHARGDLPRLEIGGEEYSALLDSRCGQPQIASYVEGGPGEDAVVDQRAHLRSPIQ